MSRIALKTRGLSPFKAIGHAFALPTVTPRKGDAWIV